MRVAVSIGLLAVLPFSVACESWRGPQRLKPGPEYACVSPGSTYPVVKKKLLPDGRCQVTWDLNLGPADAQGHPEIALLTDRKPHKSDVMVFTHGGGVSFHYAITPHPAPGSDESLCVMSPVPYDPQANTPLSTHTPGPVQRNDGSIAPQECHYGIEFDLDDGNRKPGADPHIKIGSGK